MNPESLYKHLSKFKGWRETLFLLVLAERSFPNYALFAEVAEVGNANEMAGIINRCWELVENKVDDPKEIDRLLIRLGNITPDPDRYDAYGVKPALLCCSIVEKALFTWVNKENRRAHIAATESFNAVVEFVEYRDGEGLDDDELVALFDSHPLVLEEKSIQEEAFKMIKAERFPSSSFIDKIRALGENDGVSNLGISLEEQE